LKQTTYENHAALAEEKAFLKNYTIPMVQLDPMKTILVFSHNHNTFDKKKLLNNMHPEYCKYSPKTVDDFIKNPFENSIKKFFLEEIDHLLAKYPPGEPNMKPDVLENMKLIEKERENIKANNTPKILLSKPGEPDVELSHEQIINIIQQQQQQLQSMATRITDQNQTIEKLQKMIFENNIKSSMSKTIKPDKAISKTQPIGDFNIAD
jgi:hypothetical protein